jgi:hypothetical protein
MSALIRALNEIDRWLDRTSIREPAVVNERLRGGGVPCLVSHALERSVREAHRHDEDARLKHVLAPQGAAADGASRRWEFVFDLPQRRAKLLSQWYLDGDAKFGRFGRECFDATVLPFPPPDHPLAQAVATGKARYSDCVAAWRDERRRTPDLPLELRDSDVAITDLQRQGLHVEQGFSLRNGLTHTGVPIWLAQTREASFYCKLS